MRQIFFKAILPLILITTSQILFGQKERKYIRTGNEKYMSALGDSGQVDTTKMKNAAELYRKAIEKSPSSYQAKYNLANTHFKLNNYEVAEREYKAIQNSIVHDTIGAKIFHNLGNAQLIQGKIKESIEAYKNALRRNPSDIETKYNLALAQSKLNQMQNQQQQQQQNHDQDQNQDNQDNQEKQQQQNQQQQESQEQQAQQQDMQETNQEQNNDKDDKDKYTKEDAARILEALQNEEQKVQDNLKKQKKTRTRPKATRDW